MSETEWIDIFGDNLISILQEHRMTQRELADACGVSESVISACIHKKRMPSLKTIINMVHVLGMDANDLIYFDDEIV